MPAHRLPVLTSALLLGAVVIGLAGCAPTAGDGTAGAPSAAAGTASAPAGGCAVVVTDPWAKAADAGMTGVFGTLSATQAVVITGASSPVAGRVEIHEVVQKDGAAVMQPKAGGLAIPAGGSAELAPGGDHLMLMALAGPVQPGDEVPITLTCSDGTTASFTAVAKPFQGGAESYAPSAGSMGGAMDGSTAPSPAAS